MSGASGDRIRVNVSKEQIQTVVIGLVVILFVGSAVGYLLVPSKMLSIVGIGSDAQDEFLVRTLAAALLALTPGIWAARHRDRTPGERSVLIGLATYLFASSLVDLDAFIRDIVGFASVPSIAFRILLGCVVVWLIPPWTSPGPRDQGNEDP
jgi:hypothetical protein